MSNATTVKPNRSPKEAATVSDLKTKIEAARAALTKALVVGDATAKLREYLRELEAEQARLEAAAADQEAAQQALAQIEADRIADNAQTLLEARDARVASIATRFVVRPLFA